MYGWAGRLRDYFYQKDKVFIVLFPLEEKGTYELAKFVRACDGWQVGERVRVSLSSGPLTEAKSLAAEAELEEIAGLAGLEIARKGWQQLPFLFVLPDSEMIGYALQLPPNLTVTQQQEAAYWELDEQLLARGLSADDFACICQPMTVDGGRCTIRGVRKGYLQEVEQRFKQADITLTDIIPAAENGQQAVLAYLTSSQRETAGFKSRPVEVLSAKHILAVWLGGLMVLSCMLLMFDVYTYRQNKDMAAEQQQELQRLASEKRDMELVSDKNTVIAARENVLLEISRQQAPWYSLLVHLGMNTTEGVFLTGLYTSAEGSQLYLEGQAVTYDALAEFVGQLAEDRATFAQDVRLDRSELVRGTAGEPTKVCFVVAVDWESGNDGNNSGKVKDRSL